VRDPYALWVSEIMLAQTRVTAAIPYYQKFLRLFPDVHSLASARLSRILRAWEGLGYYARARNLHQAARIIVQEHCGRFPRDVHGWENLPGVGKYTAAAITAFAYGDAAAALDANVRRVLARIYFCRGSLIGTRAERKLEACYSNARGSLRPGTFLQAMMDLGQIVCLPKEPRCEACPVAVFCLAKSRGWQNRLPHKEPAKRIPHYQVAAAAIIRGGQVLLAQRKREDLLGGMWEFPGGKQEPGETLEACLRRELREELGVHVRVREPLLRVPHAFSHFRITLHLMRCDGLRGTPRPLEAAAVRWVSVSDLGKYPMGRADRIAADWLREGNSKGRNKF
jgi:A/G-specific adenine glycosylase